MTPSLPDPIARYFQISNGADAAGLEDCFTDDAQVHDERQTHRGHAAIRSWHQAARSKFAYTVEPRRAVEQGDRHTVTAHVVGDFPGSPVELDHVFELADGRIRSLEIG